MHVKRNEAKRGPSSSNVDLDQLKMDIKSILKDIEFLGSSHMTWKQKKDLENKKVVSLGGKPPKKQRLPLSVARVTMKKQKERDEKMIQERALLGRFGAYSSSSSSMKVAERRRPEERILKSTVGDFRKGVLDVRHMLKPSAPEASHEKGKHAMSKGKKKKDGKKGHGKRKGSGRKRH
ncbi:axoneme-associated protein [Perilla frutescens var. frutescens]|nr:axoneme-associated protein [Perilla frutescens var. frutescens]